MMSDAQYETLYAAITDAIAHEVSDGEINALIESYNVSQRAEVDSMVALITRLHTTLLGVKPSQRFLRELRRDLLASYQAGLVGRLRRLPARVQIAAMLVMIGGFLMLFTRHRAELSKVETAIG